MNIEDLANLDLSDEVKQKIIALNEKDVSGLKNKNTELLDAQKQLKKSIDGLDIDGIKNMLAQQQDAKEQEMLKNGQISEYLDLKLAKERDVFNARIEALEEQNKTLTTDKENAVTKLNTTNLENFARAEAAKIEDLHTTAAEDLILRAQSVWKATENGFEAFDGDKPILKDAKPIAFTDWVESFRETAPHYFNKAKGTGAPGSSGGSDNLLQYFMGDTKNLTKQNEIYKSDPAQYTALKKQAAEQGNAA